MLQACLNGGRSKSEHARLPVTPEEIAADAAAACAAGADALHVHPRDAEGRESLAPADVAACIAAVRRAAPGVPVGVGTGAWIAPGGRARHALIERWETLPDYASVNLNEEDAPEMIDLLLGKGVGVEAGVWNVADAERFVTLSAAPRCLRMLLEMTSEDPEAAEAEYRRTLAVVRGAGLALPILLHGDGASVWRMVDCALEDGHDTRVGFEDGLTLPDGRVAESNAEIVSEAARRTANA